MTGFVSPLRWFADGPPARRDAVRLAAAYSGVFALAGGYVVFAPVWLKAQGLSADAVAAAVAVGMLSRSVMAVVGGVAADVWRRPRLILVTAALLQVAMFLLHWPAAGAAALILVTGLVKGAGGPMTPLVETAALRSVTTTGMDYGRVRAVGSAVFIAANLGCGALIDWAGDHAALWWFVGAAVVCALGVSLTPVPKPGEAAQRPQWKGLGAAMARQEVALAIAASAVIQASHGFYYAFSAIVWTEDGYSELVVGALWGWGVAAEIVFLAFAARAADRFGPGQLLMFGAACGVIRWTLTGLSPPLAALFALQTLHAGTFAVAHMGFIAFARRYVPEEAAASVQALNSALSFGVILAMATALSGVLYARFDAFGYWAMAAIAGAGLGVAAALSRRIVGLERARLTPTARVRAGA